jgi:predicted dehydrogenase
MMNKTIRWGVLGAAAIAIGRTMPAMLESPSASLFALASRDAAKGRAVADRFEIERLYGSYDELLADPGIDAVYVPFTVATQAGPNGWGSHQQLSVLGGSGWLRMDFPCAHARPTACHIEVGDATSVGYFPTSRFEFEPVNHYGLQIERFSRLLLGETVPSWPIEDALGTLGTIEALFNSARQGGWIELNVETS